MMSCTCGSPSSTLNAAGTETGAVAEAVAVASAEVAVDGADVAAVEAATAAAVDVAAVLGRGVPGTTGALLGRLAAGNAVAAALAGTEGATGALPPAPSLLGEAAACGASVPAGVGAGCCGGNMGPSAGISALHVGQTCCMTSHERRQSM